MPDREQRGEASGIGPLRNRQPQQQHRLEDGDEAADQERHAVEIGDLLRRKIERSSQYAGKYEHPRHAENVLQSEDQKLIIGQAFIDADVEDFLGRRFPGLHVFAFAFLLRVAPACGEPSAIAGRRSMQRSVDECAGAGKRAPASLEMRVPQMPRINHVRPDFQRHGNIGCAQTRGKARCIGEKRFRRSGSG